MSRYVARSSEKPSWLLRLFAVLLVSIPISVYAVNYTLAYSQTWSIGGGIGFASIVVLLVVAHRMSLEETYDAARFCAARFGALLLVSGVGASILQVDLDASHPLLFEVLLSLAAGDLLAGGVVLLCFVVKWVRDDRDGVQPGDLEL